MTPLSEWLQIMLGEIARKRGDLEGAREEEAKRAAETKSAAEKVEGSAPPAQPQRASQR